jgi:hypothetical protein
VYLNRTASLQRLATKHPMRMISKKYPEKAERKGMTKRTPGT